MDWTPKWLAVLWNTQGLAHDENRTVVSEWRMKKRKKEAGRQVEGKEVELLCHIS